MDRGLGFEGLLMELAASSRKQMDRVRRNAAAEVDGFSLELDVAMAPHRLVIMPRMPWHLHISLLQSLFTS
jgi:hypothetical protein